MTSGDGFGGSFLAEYLLARQGGQFSNYLDAAHYQRVQAAHVRAARKARAAGVRPPPPPDPPMRK